METKKFYITINRHIIKANKKNNTINPPISSRHGKNGKPDYSSAVTVYKPKSVTVVYKPYAPLKCGATAWIEIELSEKEGKNV